VGRQLDLISVFVGWWLLFSRVPWLDRIACILLCVVAGCLIWPARHPSIEPQYGALMYVVYAISRRLWRPGWVGCY